MLTFPLKNRWSVNEQIVDFFPLHQFHFYFIDRYVHIFVKIRQKLTETVAWDSPYMQ